MSNVQFQQVQVSRFREHLAMRDHLVKDLERAEREKLKAQEDRQRAVSPGSAGKRQGRPMIFSKGPGELVSFHDEKFSPFLVRMAVAYNIADCAFLQDEILSRKTEAAAQLQARLDRITRALTFCEIHRFNKDRQQSITGLVGALAAAHLQVCEACNISFSRQFLSLTLCVIGCSDGSSDHGAVDGAGHTVGRGCESVLGEGQHPPG